MRSTLSQCLVFLALGEVGLAKAKENGLQTMTRELPVMGFESG